MKENMEKKLKTGAKKDGSKTKRKHSNAVLVKIKQSKARRLCRPLDYHRSHEDTLAHLAEFPNEKQFSVETKRLLADFAGPKAVRLGRKANKTRTFKQVEVVDLERLSLVPYFKAA